MEEGTKHPIDAKFRQELYDQSIAPRADLWKNIQAKRAPNKPLATLPKLWIAAAILGVASLVAWLQWPEKSTDDNIPSLAENTESNTNVANPLVSNDDNSDKPAGDLLSVEENTNFKGNSGNNAIKNPAAYSNSGNGDANRNTLNHNSERNTLPILENEQKQVIEPLYESETPMKPELSESMQEKETTAPMVGETSETILMATNAPEKTVDEQKANKKIRENRGPWSIELSGSPDINGKDFRKYPSNLESYVQAREEAESYPLGWSAMLRINYAVNPALRINAGLRYAKINEQVSFHRDNYSARVELNYRNGYILDPFNNPIPIQIPVYDTVTVNNPFSMQATNTYQVLDIPFGIAYRLFEHKRFSFGLQSGLSFNLRFTGNGYIVNNSLNGEQNLNGNGSPLNVSAGFGYYGGIQFNYRISNRLEVFLEPTLRASGPQLISNGEGYRLVYQSFSNYCGLRFNL